MYDAKSMKAEEFIDHNEIMATLEYAAANKNNAALISEIIEKAKLRKGLSHREAAVLLDCELEDKNAEIFALAEQIKKDFYGNRIVMFAPLYLSNYCINGCVYCPYHSVNKHIARKNSLRMKSVPKLLPCRIWGINAWHWKPVKTRLITLLNIFLNQLKQFTALNIKTAQSAG